MKYNIILYIIFIFLIIYSLYYFYYNQNKILIESWDLNKDQKNANSNYSIMKKRGGKDINNNNNNNNNNINNIKI